MTINVGKFRGGGFRLDGKLNRRTIEDNVAKTLRQIDESARKEPANIREFKERREVLRRAPEVHIVKRIS